MRDPMLPQIGAALRQARKQRGLSQTDVAARVGRPTPRISELETDLLRDSARRDRLGLLAEVCDALNLVLLVAPRDTAVGQAGGDLGVKVSGAPMASRFDELFIDLADRATRDRER